MTIELEAKVAELVKIMGDNHPDVMTEEELTLIGDAPPPIYNAACDAMDVSAESRAPYKDYCWEKLCAVVTRKAGCIAAALRYERNADRIYKQLPSRLQW